MKVRAFLRNSVDETRPIVALLDLMQNDDVLAGDGVVAFRLLENQLAIMQGLRTLLQREDSNV